jgi:hypothetical protein
MKFHICPIITHIYRKAKGDSLFCSKYIFKTKNTELTEARQQAKQLKEYEKEDNKALKVETILHLVCYFLYLVL